MKNAPRLIFLTVLLTVLLVAGNTGVTSSDFLDLEDSSENSLGAINNWYNLAWYWRKPVTISNSGGALTDYQVKITVNTQELISAGKMLSDGDDIRFSQSDGVTDIPYWIESGIDTASTIIWAKVPSIPAGDSTIYFYYSNPGASAVSSVSSTFGSGSFQDLFGDITKLDTNDSSSGVLTSGETRLLVASTEVMDISQTASAGTLAMYGDQWVGQTVTAGFNGFLTKVTVRSSKVGNPPGDLIVEIRNAVGNEPGDTVYTTASRDDITATMGDYDFNLNIAVPVSNGTQYAIITRTDGGDVSNYYNFSYNTEAYPGGRALLSTDGGSIWAGYDAYDCYFKPYITVDSVLDQSQIAAAIDQQVYGNEWSAQSFIAGQTGGMTMAVINGYATGSPPNGLTVEIQNTEEYIAEVIDQSQTSYSGTRNVYDNSWGAQTFRTGSSGEMGKVTVRASATGSPPNDLTVELRNVTTGIQEAEDQSQTSYSGDRQVYGNNWEGQVFQAGTSGNMSKVTLNAAKVGSPSGALTVELHDVSGSSEENLDQSQTNSSASASFYGNTWVGQTFQAGASGQLSKVSLTLERTENEDQSQTSYSGDKQVYGNNWEAQIFQAGVSGNLSRVTLRTAKTGAPPGGLTLELRDITQNYQDIVEQSQTSYTGDRQVYGNNWEAQVFEAGASGNLTKVSLRASKTGSPPNDLTVELRDTISGYQENEDQSQTSYTGDRQVYGNNWEAQVFQAGISGSLNKITLNAAKVGSPSGNLTVELRNVIPEEIIDQSQTSFSPSQPLYANVWAAQTFQAGATGQLSRVTIRVAKTGSPADPLVVEIRDCTGGDLPGTTVYASASKNPGDITSEGEYEFVFGSPASITSGTKYTIVVYSASGDGSNNYPIYYLGSDAYANGRACLSTNSGGSWIGYAFDIQFLTYVTLSTYVPGTTVYATTSRGDITSAGAYDFTYSSPYSVTSGTRYAMVIYTSGGDAGNNYTVSYDNADAYASGQEGSSANGGTDWTGSGSTDLYFRTYVTVAAGFEPGTTVYATTSRSDITTAGEYDFTYSSPYSLSSGARYAIVIYTTSGNSTDYYNVSYQNSDAYANGRECSSMDGGTDWTGSDTTDLYFITYVPVLGSYIPGSTVYASISRSDITTAGEYNFTFSTPCAVTSDTKYAMVIYTSGGDASNYYTVSYQNSSAYSDGTECTSSNGGTDWAASSAADLYFRTKMGVALGDIEVQIRNCTVDDLPGATLYTSASKDPLEIGTTSGAYDFTFTTPASVTSGVKYSITVSGNGGDADNNFRLYYQAADPYANGRAAASSDAGSSWTPHDTLDAYFQTYVSLNAYNPGSTVYATASRSDITTAGEYEFSFSTPYAITGGTKYAIVIYTSGGDAGNNYTVSYNNSDSYANGRECYSTSGGSSWTGSTSTDLFFRTYITVQIGDTPGTTVYASASRSDVTTEGDYDFVFSTPYTVTADTSYAIVIYTSGGGVPDRYNISYQNSDAYSFGKECSSADGGSNWSPSNSTDLYFKTYIDMATGKYQPGGTVYASATRSDIGSSAGDYVFYFSTPVSVTSGSRYTIVVKTTGGDVANCYNVAYQNVDIYANGDHSFSSNAGTDWTMTAHDLWFKTYVEYDRAISASGVIRSVTVPVDDATRLAVGGQLSWNDTVPGSSDIKYQVEYYTGSAWNIIPDGALPGNSTGFSSSPVDISSVTPDYGMIRLRANMSSTYSTDIPSVQDWMATYYYREYTGTEPAVSDIGTEE